MGSDCGGYVVGIVCFFVFGVENGVVLVVVLFDKVYFVVEFVGDWFNFDFDFIEVFVVFMVD